MTTTTSTLSVPGATLHYELRGSGPLLALVGAPMDARSFEPLADRLAADYTVLTTDPRGINRSPLEVPDQDSTPELRAEDLARLIEHVDAGPATVFGSSGGAVTVLALTQCRPDLVRCAIAHEPPLEELLEDRDELRANTEKMVALYLSGDVVGAWMLMFESANLDLPPGAVEHMFGGERDPQDVADEHFWFAHELRASTWWLPDLELLRKVSSRLVIGIGAESTGQACDRTSRTLAASLELEPVIFPGDHTGFVEHAGDFVDVLRKVLADG